MQPETEVSECIGRVAESPPLPSGLVVVTAQRSTVQQGLQVIQRQELEPMAKNEQTSKSVASKASKLLSSPRTPPAIKSVAASALTQAPNKGGGKKR